MVRKKQNDLPKQFVRAKRLAVKPRKQEKKSNAKNTTSLLQSLQKLFGFSVQKKVEPKRKAPKKTTPKKVTKKPKKKKKGVIATKAEHEHLPKVQKTKKAPTKAKKKVSKKKEKPKKSAVRRLATTKKAVPKVHFKKVNVHQDQELLELEEKKSTKQKRALPKAEVFPRMVQNDDIEDSAPKVSAGIMNKKKRWSFFGKKIAVKKPTLQPVAQSGVIAVRSSVEAGGVVQDLKQEIETLEKQAKTEGKKMAKQRAKEIKELRKKAKQRAKEMAAEEPEEEEVETQKTKMLKVDQRLAEKEVEKKEKELRLEEQERRKSKANQDLDAMASELVRTKKTKRKGLSSILKSINNLGMGKFRVQFVQNLAMMLNAGLPLIDALNTLQLEIRHKAMRKIIGKITELVESGYPLWRAMDEQYLFSPYEVALVRVGEEAGNLSRNMVYLADQQEKDHALRQKVKMAMIYPSIVFILMFIVVMGLGLFVLPNLVQVLYSLNADLPPTTRAVIFITEMFSKYGKQGVPAMMGGMVVLFLLAKYTAFRRVSQWMVFRIPGIGRLAREATIARFGVILGGLLEAGVPLVESLQSLEDVTHIVSYKKMYRQMTERVALGDSFAICFKDIRGSRKLIPASMQQLIITGERSGSLSETFMKVASIYEKKAEETAEKLPTILEPVLLLIIGGLVGTIAFAIITPIYSVVGNVGR